MNLKALNNLQTVTLREGKNQPSGMVLVAAGTFLMGSEQGGEFERPIHEVHLGAFWMDETPVTNDQFAAFVEGTNYQTEAECAGSAWGHANGKFREVAGLSWRSYAAPERVNHPVVLVSWSDSVAYARWADKRLPTEAEWEKAARGGLTGDVFPWGKNPPDGTQSNFASKPAEIAPTTSVKAFPPNAFGLYDMVGNVWQWCADWYAGDYYSKGPRMNPTGPSGGDCRVRRGGSWNVIQGFRLRAANRGALNPRNATPNVGFRCVLSAVSDTNP